MTSPTMRDEDEIAGAVDRTRPHTGQEAETREGRPISMDSAPADLRQPPIDFYRHALLTLQRAGIRFLVGGAYALRAYTGIERHTKDLDIFLMPQDVSAALDALAAAGYRTELTSGYWLAKAFSGDAFVDLIFCSGNGAVMVDEVWFQQARPAEVFGLPVRLTPLEEMIWSKSFVMERERYDGADIAHVLLKHGDRLDWERLIERFGPNWRVLLHYLVLFGFIYPGQRDRIPRAVMERLLARLHAELDVPPPNERICDGTLLSRQQFLIDVVDWGFNDGRLVRGDMSVEQIEECTAGIQTDRTPPPTGAAALARVEERRPIVLHEPELEQPPAPPRAQGCRKVMGDWTE